MTTANHHSHTSSHHHHREGEEEANEANGHHSHHHHHHHDGSFEKKEETSPSHSPHEIHIGCAGAESTAHSHNDHTSCSGGHHHEHEHAHVEDDDVTDRDERRTSELTSSMTGRSQFHVPEICCSSEIPGINSIVQSMEGVVSVKVAVATKTVYVNHDITKVSSGDISQGRKLNGLLNHMHMYAFVLMPQSCNLTFQLYLCINNIYFIFLVHSSQHRWVLCDDQS